MVEPSRDYFTARDLTPTQTRSGFGTGDGRQFHREQQGTPHVPGSSTCVSTLQQVLEKRRRAYGLEGCDPPPFPSTHRPFPPSLLYLPPRYVPSLFHDLDQFSTSTTALSSPDINTTFHPSFQPDFRTLAFRAPVDHFPPPMTDSQGDRPAHHSSQSDTSVNETTHPQAHSRSRSNQPTFSSFPTPPATVLGSPRSSDNSHGAASQQSQQSSPHVYYGPGPRYNSQAYAISAQPPPPFEGFPSPFPGPRVGEGGMTSQNPHARFQPMLQPHVPFYYHPHASAPVRTHFQPMHYPPASPSHFSYAPRSFPNSPPVYSYPSHHPYAPPEVDTQGAWYYLPHTSQHGESAATYPSHYPSYPSITPLDVEAEHPAAVATQEHSAYPLPASQQEVHSPNSGRSPALQTPVRIQSPADGTKKSDAGADATTNHPRQEKSMIRKPYHPNPPAHRSEWVMWVGNIPSDATHDELWKFFNQPPASNLPADTSPSTRPSSSTDQPEGSGVISIFLISKSSCVFVNYETGEHLTRAIEGFNGRPLRLYDPRSLRLVCRVRKRDDDLKAGVGGQRGQGLHAKWIKDKKSKEKQAQHDVSPSSQALYSQAMGSGGVDHVDQLMVHTSDLTLSSDDEGKFDVHASHRSSSGSFASTDSSLLSTFFPKRYFILKSLTQYDLDLSIRHGIWATQKHNEGVLDQAYRTSKDVYLIFGVNKAGEFYGYARMAGPVQHGAKNVLWASRAKDLASASRHSQHSSQIGATDPASQSTPLFLDVVQDSPDPLLASSEDDGSWSEAKTPGPRRDLSSAPAELGNPHRQISMRKPIIAKHMTVPNHPSAFELDPGAPLRAIRSGAKPGDSPLSNPSLLRVEEEHDQDDDPDAVAESQHGIDTWGDCFKIEWLCTERLPFYWSRNLRNPWNHDREVKISRDGTELEPTVGSMLLNAWEVMRAEGGEIPPSGPGSGSTAKKGGQIRRHTGGARVGPENLSKSSGR